MKKIILILIAILPIFVLAQITPDGKNWKHTGTNEFTKQIILQTKTLSGTKIDGWDATKTKVDGAVDATQYFPAKADSNYTKPGSWTSRFDFKYEITNAEQWKLWKRGGSDISPLMPTYPIVNIGATALVDGRLYLYRFYTPDTTTVHGFRIVLSASFSGTADNYNGIYLYRYSNDSVYAIGNTPNSATFWTGSTGASIDKPLTANVTIPPGFYAVAPIYNNSAQTTAPTMEAPYITNIAKSVTFTGGWRTTTFINGVTTPAASYKYSGVSGETGVPHIILVY